MPGELHPHRGVHELDPERPRRDDERGPPAQRRLLRGAARDPPNHAGLGTEADLQWSNINYSEALGADTFKAGIDFFGGLARTIVPVSGLETAELVKVSANAFLATKISFINAMAELCETTGADVTVLAETKALVITSLTQAFGGAVVAGTLPDLPAPQPVMALESPRILAADEMHRARQRSTLHCRIE